MDTGAPAPPSRTGALPWARPTDGLQASRCSQPPPQPRMPMAGAIKDGRAGPPSPKTGLALPWSFTDSWPMFLLTSAPSLSGSICQNELKRCLISRSSSGFKMIRNYLVLCLGGCSLGFYFPVSVPRC